MEATSKGGSDMTSRIRIKMGTIEVDYEGSEEFLKNDLLGLLESIVTIYVTAQTLTAKP